MVPRTLRYLFAAAAIGGLVLACGNQADARPPYSRTRPVPAYSFTVEDENGNALPTFRKNGRTFLLGEPGQRYNIRVQNPTGERVEAVVSVDGRDAVSGDPGDYVNGRGYVLPPYGSVVIEGFRRSLDEVATFRFTSPENSYSSRMGTPENVGVIGVAFFTERVPPPPPVVRRPVRRPVPYDYDYQRPRYDSEGAANGPPSPPIQHPEYAPRRAPAPSPGSGAGSSDGSRSAAAEAPAKSAAKGAPSDRSREAARDDYDSRAGNDLHRGRVNNLGTEFGETRESAVSSVAFERAAPTHPVVITSVRYDDANGLRARGIDLSPLGYYASTRPSDSPDPFPASRFALPPPYTRDHSR